MFKMLLPTDRLAFLVNLLVLIACIGLIFTHTHLPTNLPLWFSTTWGEGRLANRDFLWLFPAFVGLFFLFSHVAAKTFAKKHAVLAEILVWSTSFISFVFLLALYKIILLVS